MTSKELNTHLIASLPMLKEAYNREVAWQEGDDTGSHVVFGDVLTPYLLDRIQEKDNDAIMLVLRFLENILQMEDTYADEVIVCSVLERIVAEEKNCDFLKSVCGGQTKKLQDLLKNLYKSFGQ